MLSKEIIDRYAGAMTPIPPMLLDFRAAYETLEQKGEHPGLKMARVMLAQSPKSFMERLASLEREWLLTERAAREHAKAESEARPAQPEPELEPDEGTERVQGLIKRLLGKLHEQQRQEDLELASRPNAAEIGGTLQKALTEALRREQVLQDRLAELERRAPTA
jgi:hypothetical protein